MPERWRSRLSAFFGLILIGGLCWGVYWVVDTVWRTLLGVDTRLAVSLLTAASTIIVSTVTVVVGKYLERKKEIESHFREKKVEIYDEFLNEFLNFFYRHHEDSGASEADLRGEDLVPFLQQWQRKIILWGGPEVLRVYVEWKNYMALHEPDAKTISLMGRFFKTMRKDVGLSNYGLDDHFFSHFLLKESEKFVEAARRDPRVKLTEVDDDRGPDEGKE